MAERARKKSLGFGGLQEVHVHECVCLAGSDINNSPPTVAYTLGWDLSGSRQGAGGIGGLLARSHGYSTSTKLKFDAATGRVIVIGGIPITIEVKVSALDIEASPTGHPAQMV